MTRALLLVVAAFLLPALGIAQEKVKSIATFEGHTDKVTSVAIHPDGKRFLSGSDDKTIRVWDIDKQKPIETLKEHQNYVLALVYSKDGKRFLSAGGGQWRGPEFATETDQFVRLWDAETLKVLKKMAGHQAPVWSVVFSPDEKHALTGSGGYPGGGRFTPAGHTMKLWDLDTGKSLRDYKDHENWVRDVRFLPDGKTLVSGSWDKTVRIWNIDKTDAMQVLRDHKDGVECIALSSDGKWLASAGGHPRAGGDCVIRLWDLSDGKVVKRFAGHTKRVWKMTFSKDNQRILSAAADNTIRLWDIGKGKETHRFVGHTDEVRQAAFTPDGKHVISASHDKTLRLWPVP
jgi:WD40 repeat protein